MLIELKRRLFANPNGAPVLILRLFRDFALYYWRSYATAIACMAFMAAGFRYSDRASLASTAITSAAQLDAPVAMPDLLRFVGRQHQDAPLPLLGDHFLHHRHPGNV